MVNYGLKRLMVCLLCFVITSPALVSAAQSRSHQELAVNHLIQVLASLNTPSGDQAASQLRQLGDQQQYTLHLRSAGLGPTQATAIAQATERVHQSGGPALRSFSLSYNPDLSDDGVLSVLKHLPPTVTEIGLVGSGLTDKGAAALMTWAKGNPQLRWLCVEDNHYSPEMQAQLQALARASASLSVVF